MTRAALLLVVAALAGCVKKAAAAAGPVEVAIDCRATRHRISPLIYGIGHSERNDPARATAAELGATAVRWGGNSSTRYNWKLGNAWNTASDWYFRNVDYSGKPGAAWARFLAENRAGGLASAVTIPMLGWVAKDTFSQPPAKTSVEAPPEFMGEWVRQIARKGSANEYILDNEPMLWHETHRDVHPEPVGYDELLDRTLRYAKAIRDADPHARIAGPAEWGWPAYFNSAIDSRRGLRLRPDRRAHGDVPLIPWYLRQLKAYEDQHHVTLLDVLDVHFYPQGKGIGLGVSGATDAGTAARRVRSVRALWDPAYRDESFIDEPVRLLPRLREWVDENYPGRRISIGEYNFGAETHISGGLAVAEALGRFAEAGIESAYYWTAPPRGSAAFWAFRAFRNFDGKGARFGDVLVSVASFDKLSAFVARDGKRVTVVAVNARTEPADVALRLEGCGAAASTRRFTYAAGEGGLEAAQGTRLPAQSISAIELLLE